MSSGVSKEQRDEMTADIKEIVGAPHAAMSIDKVQIIVFVLIVVFGFIISMGAIDLVVSFYWLFN